MNTHRIQFQRARFAALALPCLLAAGPAFGGEADPVAEAAGKKELVRLQMINDMMYASDDFFGETRPFIYVDQPLPPAAPAEGPAPVAAREKTGNDVPSPPDNGGGDPGGGDCPT
jgi:hypothetical protein